MIFNDKKLCFNNLFVDIEKIITNKNKITSTKKD